MNNCICKAKAISDGKWIYGYYVKALWENSLETVHIIIETNAEYKGAGEFSWKSVRRVDPDTVCWIGDYKDESN